MRIEGLVGFAHTTCAAGLQDLRGRVWCCDPDSSPDPFRLPLASQTEVILRVQSYSGRKANERPVRFQLGDREYVVNEVVDQMVRPGRRLLQGAGG